MFSLLPAPKHASTKEVGRVLLPHTLSNKTNAAATKKAPKQTVPRPPVHSGLSSGVTDSKDGSDDEDDSVNFFSLGQEDKPITPTVNPLPEARDASTTTARNISSGVIHEPSLRGPWLGPAAPASDLLGPSLQPAGLSMPSYSKKAVTDIKDNYVTTTAAANINVDSPQVVAPELEINDGPIHTTQYSGDYGQVKSRCSLTNFKRLCSQNNSLICNSPVFS